MRLNLGYRQPSPGVMPCVWPTRLRDRVAHLQRPRTPTRGGAVSFCVRRPCAWRARSHSTPAPAQALPGDCRAGAECCCDMPTGPDQGQDISTSRSTSTLAVRRLVSGDGNHLPLSRPQRACFQRLRRCTRNLRPIPNVSGWQRRPYLRDSRVKNKKLPNPTDTHVGCRVRLRRIALGLTQTNIASALGITFQQVQKYERGTNRIGASRLHRLAKILQVDPAFFFEGDPAQKRQYSSGPNYVTEFLAMSEGPALTKAFQKLPTDKLRRRVVALIQELADREG
jgi:transcriptional regulator with XRE-family HTH domain